MTPRPLPDRFVMTPARRAAVEQIKPTLRPYIVPRPLPDTDGHPSDLFWPTVALFAAAATTAAYVTVRTLLRRLP